MSLGRLLAAQRRYLGAETFQLSFLLRAGLGAGRRLWVTAGVRQYGHLLAAPAHGGRLIGSLGQRLIVRKLTFAPAPRAGLTPPG